MPGLSGPGRLFLGRLHTHQSLSIKTERNWNGGRLLMSSLLIFIFNYLYCKVLRQILNVIKQFPTYLYSYVRNLWSDIETVRNTFTLVYFHSRKHCTRPPWQENKICLMDNLSSKQLMQFCGSQLRKWTYNTFLFVLCQKKRLFQNKIFQHVQRCNMHY